MFSYIKGILAEKAANHAVVECGGWVLKFIQAIILSRTQNAFRGRRLLFIHIYISKKELWIYTVFLQKRSLNSLKC